MIATQIDDLRNAIQRDDLARVNAASEKLFKTLVEPAAIELAQAHAIIFIADETASRIPLALLRDPVARLYLVLKEAKTSPFVMRRAIVIDCE